MLSDLPVIRDRDGAERIVFRVMAAGQALIDALAAEAALSGGEGATPGGHSLLDRWKSQRTSVIGCEETYSRLLAKWRESLQQLHRVR
jgi:hypothetical protein